MSPCIYLVEVMLINFQVSFGNYTYPIAQDFLRATESQGIPTTDDL